MGNTKIDDYNIPEYLYPNHKLIDMDIIRYGIFFRKIPIFNKKNIIYSSNESISHIELKALAYYELLHRYPQSKIEFESHYGISQELDLRCSVGGITKVVVEVGDSNVNFDNVLNRGLNISEEVWLIPYNNDFENLSKGKPEIYPIISFTRGKHWSFFLKLKQTNEFIAQSRAMQKPHATITIGTNSIGYYINEVQYSSIEKTSIENGYINPTLFILDILNNIYKLSTKEIGCLSCTKKINILDNYCRNCGVKIDNLNILNSLIEKKGK